ncbi:hypothetical protein [Thermostichus vulcanus]|uniref:Uncharacterized protein n=1 Tax=Thermostichus vulcanus str. 'Rupite' TaxID=2813851 RepID=A0ABT0CEK0_THEVL|nr:hypothetical protein [Thermostichus vulcanus]MCJ2544198.1 hypothetical protein [Thermostichus vulcanus str. 'Rupite']
MRSLLESRFFGLTQDEPIVIPEVTESKLLEEIREDDDGRDYKVYQVILLSRKENPVPITVFSSKYTQQARILDHINTFIKSNEPSFILHYDTGSIDEIILIIPMLAMIAIGVIILIFAFYSESFILDRTMNRLYIKSSITPLWRWRKEYSLTEIKAVSIAEDKDSDGDTFYKAEIALNSGECLTLTSINHLSDLEQLCRSIQQFLDHALPYHVDFHYRKTEASAAEPSEAVHQDAESSLVFVGKYGTYSTQNRSIETMPASCRCHHQDLLGLGFKFLGELQIQKISMVLWCYAHSKADIYAVLYDAASMPPILDLYSTFLNGASLTTSNSKSWIKDIPKCKIYRSIYPNASTQELYRHHSQRLIALIPQLGRTRSIGDLRDLAISIDDYRGREPSGLVYKVLLYIRPIWSWLMTGSVY